MNSRYNEVRGAQVAGAITYFGFLSFFPLLALVYAAVGYISVWFPNAEQAITDAVNAAFPSLIGPGPGQIDISDVESGPDRCRDHRRCSVCCTPGWAGSPQCGIGMRRCSAPSTSRCRSCGPSWSTCWCSCSSAPRWSPRSW
jgi:hypothetical protein